MPKPLYANLQGVRPVVLTYISLLFFRVNTTTMKSHSHLPIYNEFIDINGIAV
jgi:hypothetical protein